MTTNRSTQCALFDSLLFCYFPYLKVFEKFDLWMIWGSDDKKNVPFYIKYFKYCTLFLKKKTDLISNISITIIILELKWTYTPISGDGHFHFLLEFISFRLFVAWKLPFVVRLQSMFCVSSFISHCALIWVTVFFLFLYSFFFYSVSIFQIHQCHTDVTSNFFPPYLFIFALYTTKNGIYSEFY